MTDTLHEDLCTFMIIYANVKYRSKQNCFIITRLLRLGYMFRLSRVIIRPSKEQAQGYLSTVFPGPLDAFFSRKMLPKFDSRLMRRG
jgi:hypothetical protein